jgi:hypothetical protein
MSHRAPQSSFVSAFQNHRRDADPGYFDSSQHSPRGGSDRQGYNANSAGVGWPYAFQLLLKAASLGGLIESRVEQHEAAVTQGKNTGNEESVPEPAQESRVRAPLESC